MMDASDFVKNYIRMCKSVGDCEQCPCGETNFCTAPPNLRSLDGAEEVVHIVEEWAAEHPLKTRQQQHLSVLESAELVFCLYASVSVHLISRKIWTASERKNHFASGI